MKTFKLPPTLGKHQLGASVYLDFEKCGIITSATVIGVKAAQGGKILYDLEMRPFFDEPENKHLVCVLKDVDSYFVKATGTRKLFEKTQNKKK